MNKAARSTELCVERHPEIHYEIFEIFFEIFEMRFSALLNRHHFMQRSLIPHITPYKLNA